MKKISTIIIGAGVSGLSAAVALKKRGVDVSVLEARPSAGGVIHTICREGYLCESGPNTMTVSKPESLAFLEEIGLLDTALDATPATKKRFVVQNGRLIPIPTSPIALFGSNFLSWKARLRIMREPFVPRGGDENETLAGFVRRRLGVEILRELVDPFVSGVHAGDPERLVIRHTFPKKYHIEQTHGSLLRGMMKAGRKTIPRHRLISWPGGLSDLVLGLSAHLENKIRLSTPVKSLKKQGAKFTVVIGRGDIEADRVIMATDAMNASRLLAPLFPDIAPLEKMPHAPMCVVHLGFPRASVGHPLDGFGFLISRSRGIRTLGTLFSSTLFPNRAPQGHILLTAFMGGMLDQQAISLDDATLTQAVLNDLRSLLRIEGPPSFQNIIRWAHAIPQYEGGHSSMLQTCQAIESACPGLYLIGNYRGGISLEDCLSNGQALGTSMPV